MTDFLDYIVGVCIPFTKWIQHLGRHMGTDYGKYREKDAFPDEGVLMLEHIFVTP